MRMIAGEGFSIENTASVFCKVATRSAMKAEQRMVGRRFRDGLDRMAIEWLGPERRPMMKSFAANGARPMEMGASFERDDRQTAHAYHDRMTGKVMVNREPSK